MSMITFVLNSVEHDFFITSGPDFLHFVDICIFQSLIELCPSYICHGHRTINLSTTFGTNFQTQQSIPACKQLDAQLQNIYLCARAY